MKLVIFDCDGTLVDSQHVILAAMDEAYRAHSLPVPERARLLSVVGLSLFDAFSALGERDPDYPVSGLMERYRAAFSSLRETGRNLEPLFPGAREAIDALSIRPGIVLGMATGKSQRGVRAVLAQHGLIHRFETIQTADDAPSKPNPAMVLQALHETGISAADTVVIGDTTYDMMMATAASASAIGVAWGYHGPDLLRSAGASAIIEDFAQLVPTLDAMWAGGTKDGH